MRQTFKQPFREREQKLNPNTLLGLLWEICGHRGFRTYQHAADTLLREADLSWKTRPMSLTRSSLSEVFYQRTPVKYWLLEAFAKQAGVPTGVLLLFSRLRSNSRKGMIHENRQLLQALAKIAKSSPDDAFPLETLSQWSEWMGTAPPPQQLSLDV